MGELSGAAAKALESGDRNNRIRSVPKAASLVRLPPFGNGTTESIPMRGRKVGDGDANAIVIGSSVMKPLRRSEIKAKASCVPKSTGGSQPVTPVTSEKK
jgi:hypothetical protein